MGKMFSAEIINDPTPCNSLDYITLNNTIDINFKRLDYILNITPSIICSISKNIYSGDIIDSKCNIVDNKYIYPASTYNPTLNILEILYIYKYQNELINNILEVDNSLFMNNSDDNIFLISIANRNMAHVYKATCYTNNINKYIDFLFNTNLDINDTNLPSKSLYNNDNRNILYLDLFNIHLYNKLLYDNLINNRKNIYNNTLLNHINRNFISRFSINVIKEKENYSNKLWLYSRTLNYNNHIINSSTAYESQYINNMDNIDEDYSYYNLHINSLSNYKYLSKIISSLFINGVVDMQYDRNIIHKPARNENDDSTAIENPMTKLCDMKYINNISYMLNNIYTDPKNMSIMSYIFPSLYDLRGMDIYRRNSFVKLLIGDNKLNFIKKFNRNNISDSNIRNRNKSIKFTDKFNNLIIEYYYFDYIDYDMPLNIIQSYHRYMKILFDNFTTTSIKIGVAFTELISYINNMHRKSIMNAISIFRANIEHKYSDGIDSIIEPQHLHENNLLYTYITTDATLSILCGLNLNSINTLMFSMGNNITKKRIIKYITKFKSIDKTYNILPSANRLDKSTYYLLYKYNVNRYMSFIYHILDNKDKMIDILYNNEIVSKNIYPDEYLYNKSNAIKVFFNRIKNITDQKSPDKLVKNKVNLYITHFILDTMGLMISYINSMIYNTYVYTELISYIHDMILDFLTIYNHLEMNKDSVFIKDISNVLFSNNIKNIKDFYISILSNIYNNYDKKYIINLSDTNQSSYINEIFYKKLHPFIDKPDDSFNIIPTSNIQNMNILEILNEDESVFYKPNNFNFIDANYLIVQRFIIYLQDEYFKSYSYKEVVEYLTNILKVEFFTDIHKISHKEE